jgi:hypothetical protein
MPTPVPITVAHGDGIGPEIMAATLHILKEAGAALEIDTIEVGEKYTSPATPPASRPVLGIRFVAPRYSSKLPSPPRKAADTKAST